MKLSPLRAADVSGRLTSGLQCTLREGRRLVSLKREGPCPVEVEYERTRLRRPFPARLSDAGCDAFAVELYHAFAAKRRELPSGFEGGAVAHARDSGYGTEMHSDLVAL